VSIKDGEGQVDAFIRSQAYEEDAFAFFQALETTTVRLPDAVCRACEREIERLHETPRSEGYRYGRFTDRNRTLILRLYEQTENEDMKRRCLDIIDQLMKYQPYAIERALSEREV